MKKLLALVAAVLLIATPVYAYHTETQTPYGITNTLNNNGSITVSWQESDGFEDNPPEYYIVYIGLTETADDVSEQTEFGFTEALSWQTFTFTAEYLYNELSVDNQKIYAKVKAFHDTNGTTSDFTSVESVLYNYDYVPNNTPPSTTTTSTTLPKAEDVVEDNITTYLAWDEYGCEHPSNPLSYKQYLEAIESGDWFGFQNGDCSDIPDVITIIVEEEENIDELDEEILRDDDLGEETIQEENEEVELTDENTRPRNEEVKLTEEEIAAIEAEIAAEEERLIQEQIDAEEELLILEELENSTIDLEKLSEEELEEFVDVIQEIEDTLEIIEIVEEIIELDIPDDIIIVIEEEVIEDEPIVVVEDTEVAEEILVEPIQEDVKKEPIELTEEEVVEEVAEIVEVIDIPIVEEDATEEEIAEVIEEYVEELETEEVIEVLEEVNDVGVQQLETVSEEVQEVIQAVVEEAIENVEELTEEQVEVVAEVLQVETKDVAIVAEAIKSDEVVAEAVEEYVERAVKNTDVENYTLADVVTEVQFETFIENPIEVLVDIDIQEINLTSIGNDMTQDQKEKAQEVVVPVILTRIASMAAFVFRRS